MSLRPAWVIGWKTKLLKGKMLGEWAQWLKILAAVLKDQSLFLSTHVWLLTTVCDKIYRSDVLGFQVSMSHYISMHSLTHKQTHTYTIDIIKNRSKISKWKEDRECPAFISVAVVSSWQANSGEKPFILPHKFKLQFITAGKLRWQECVLQSSAEGKWMEACSFAFMLLLSWISPPFHGSEHPDWKWCHPWWDESFHICYHKTVLSPTLWPQANPM